MEGLAEQAFRKHYGQIYRYLRRKTGDPNGAEELTQEVFADAAVTISRMSSPPGSVVALLYTIAGRRFADYARHESHVVHTVPLEEIDDLASDAPSPAYGCEVAHAIHDGIARLGVEQRLVLSMKLLEGCSFREIAATVGSTEAAVKMRFQRGLGLLRHELELQGIEP
jgi:RNA polymerase sigma-70 factor (ECF subfamily)